MTATASENLFSSSIPLALRPGSDLIYDVGLFEGEDTAYYLYRGYRVVAIDANPLMVESARARFRDEVQDARLTLLNVGIADTPGSATFWVSDIPEWSSFNQEVASRDGTASRPISVPVAPFARILRQYGTPHYLKIDIEGNDGLCVASLKDSVPPQFISVEAECVGDSTVLSEEQCLQMLYQLRDVGYRRFKLVSQAGLTAVRTNPAANFGLQLAVSAAQGRLRITGLSKIAERFTDSARTAGLGFKFLPGSTGPWGDDIVGEWMTFEKARSIYLRERRLFFLRKRALYSFWHDWHATY